MNNVTNRGCMMVSCGSGVSRRGGQPDAGGAARRDRPAAGEDLAHVVEHDHAVAQQAPALLRVRGDGAGGVAVPAVSRGARGLVGTHGAPPLWGLTARLPNQVVVRISGSTEEVADLNAYRRSCGQPGARGHRVARWQILIALLTALTTNVHR